MSKLLFLLFAIYKTNTFVSCQGGAMLGPGLWSLISISKCPDEDLLDDIKVKFEVDKHKLNRTHDGISAKIQTTDDIGDTFASLIEVCKYVDGGCKPYQVISDESLPHFFAKYAQENLVAALELAKLDPPDFPIAKGDYNIENYVMDYCKLPRESVYGDFEALAFIISEEKKVACIKCILEFKEFEDGNFCDAET